MRNKIIIAAVIVVALVVVLALVFRKKSAAPTTENPGNQTGQQITWLTYQSQALHFQINYPNYWVPSENSEAGETLISSQTPAAAPDNYPVGGIVAVSYANIFGMSPASTTLATVKAVYPSGESIKVNNADAYKVVMANQSGQQTSQIYIQPTADSRVYMIKAQPSEANSAQSQALIDQMVNSFKVTQ